MTPSSIASSGSTGRSCVELACTCSNGDPAKSVEEGCTASAPTAHVCKTCQESYVKDDTNRNSSTFGHCLNYSCRCPNGIAANSVAKGCTIAKKDTTVCDRCNPGYDLDKKNECVKLACTCEYGKKFVWNSLLVRANNNMVIEFEFCFPLN